MGDNEEGPLPWIERDYTPVSSAKEWEQGRCELLIKVYPTGAATSWLHTASPPRLWLSKPHKTLGVPGLVEEGRAFRPGSVLLLLANSPPLTARRCGCHKPLSTHSLVAASNSRPHGLTLSLSLAHSRPPSPPHSLTQTFLIWQLSHGCTASPPHSLLTRRHWSGRTASDSRASRSDPPAVHLDAAALPAPRAHNNNSP